MPGPLGWSCRIATEAPQRVWVYRLLKTRINPLVCLRESVGVAFCWYFRCWSLEYLPMAFPHCYSAIGSTVLETQQRTENIARKQQMRVLSPWYLCTFQLPWCGYLIPLAARWCGPYIWHCNKTNFPPAIRLGQMSLHELCFLDSAWLWCMPAYYSIPLFCN